MTEGQGTEGQGTEGQETEGQGSGGATAPLCLDNIQLLDTQVRSGDRTNTSLIVINIQNL